MPTLDDLYGWNEPEEAAEDKPKSSKGEFSKGLGRSFAEIPGMAAGVGAYAADVVGADGARDSMLGYAKDRQDKVEKEYGSDAASLSNVIDGKAGAGDFLANAAGYVVGQAVMSIATGGLGALGAKMLAKQGITQMGEKFAAEQLTKHMAGGLAQDVALAEATKDTTKFMASEATKAGIKGATVGSGAQNLGMELGSIYPDAVEQAGGADNLTGMDKLRVGGSALAAAGVETLVDKFNAQKILGGGKTFHNVVGKDSTLLKRAAYEVPMGMAREAGTEAVQTGIERFGADKSLTDAEAMREYVDAAGVGAVGGGMAGAGASVRQQKLEEKPPPVDPLAQQIQAQIDKGDSPLSRAVVASDQTITVDHRGVVGQLRAIDPDAASAYVSDLNISQNTTLDPVVREAAKARMMDQVKILQVQKDAETQAAQVASANQAGQNFATDYMPANPEQEALNAAERAGAAYQEMGLQPTEGSIEEQRVAEIGQEPGAQWQQMSAGRVADGPTVMPKNLNPAPSTEGVVTSGAQDGASIPAPVPGGRSVDGGTVDAPGVPPGDGGGAGPSANQGGAQPGVLGESTQLSNQVSDPTLTGESNGIETAQAVTPEAGQQEAPKPRKQVEAPHVFIPAADGAYANMTAAVRKRKAQLSTMVGQGFGDVEMRGKDFFLVNTKTNSELKLENAGDAARAKKAISDHQATLVSTEQNSLAGAPIDKEWTAFAPDSGTLNIPRAEMPQIKSEHRGAMVNYLNARGIRTTTNTVDPDSLKPTQMEFSPAKVKKAQKFEGTDRPVLVSSDGHILDGHHQWLAKKADGKPVKIIRLGAPISELLKVMKDFPSAGMTKEAEPLASGATPVYAQQQTTGVGNDGTGSTAGSNQDSGSVAGGGQADGGGDAGRLGSENQRAGSAPELLRGASAQPSGQGDAGAQTHLNAKDRQAQSVAHANANQATVSSVPGTRATVANPNSESTQQLDTLLDIFAKLTGKRGIAISEPGGGDGFAYRGNFFVNADTPWMHVAWTIAHEFKHLTEKNPGLKHLYDRLWSMIDNEAGKQEYFNYLWRTHDNIGAAYAKGTPYQQASKVHQELLKDEMLADFIGKRFSDREWLTKLSQQKPNLFGEFIREWIPLLDTIITALRGMVDKMAGVKNVDQYISQLEDAKNVATEVAIAWAERNPKLAESTGAGSVIQHSVRAGVKEIHEQDDYLVPEIEGFNSDTGNIMNLPSFEMTMGDKKRAYAAMPVRIRLGQHTRPTGPTGSNPGNVGQYGAQHRSDNAAADPRVRGLKAPAIGADGIAHAERVVRDMTAAVLQSQLIFPDKKTPSSVVLYNRQTQQSVVLDIETDMDGVKFWSVKTIIPKSESFMRSSYGIPASVNGITFDGIEKQQSNAFLAGTLKKLQEPNNFPGSGDSFTVTDDGLFVKQQTASQPELVALPPKKQLARDANGKIILNKNKIQQSARDDLQQELQDQLDGKLVSDAALLDKGRMAEDAYPDLAWVKNGKYQETSQALDDRGHTQRIEMNEDLHSDLWAVGMSHTWVGPNLEETDGRATKKGIKDFARRQVAAVDLRKRNFDLVSTIEPEKMVDLVSMWKTLDKLDGSHRYDKKGAFDKGLAEIAKSMGVGEKYFVSVRKQESEDDAQTLEMVFRDKKTNAEYSATLTLNKGKGTPYLDANTMMLGKSGLGSAFYQAASEYAAVRGYQLKPESSISGINTYRRTEQQISAALRTGRSNVMEPHPTQRVYGFDNRPMTQAKHDANLARLLLAGVRNAQEIIPSFDKLRYNPETGVFTDTRGKDMEPAVRKLLSMPDSRAFGMGRSTLARSVMTNMILKGELKDVTSFKEPVLYSARDTAEQEYKAVESQYKGKPGWMKAPNGEATKLTERQWVQVRTPSFINFFGDWTTGNIWGREDVSKVVGDDGEPLVVYHGTDKGGFYTFKKPGGKVRGDVGIFTTSNRSMAESYLIGREKDLSPPDSKEAMVAAGYLFYDDENGVFHYDTPDGDEVSGFKTMDDAVASAIQEFDPVDEVKSGVYATFMNLRSPYETDFEGALWSGERNEQYQVFDQDGDTIYAEDGRAYLSHEEATALAALHDGVVEAAGDHWETTDSAARDGHGSGQDGTIIRNVIDNGSNDWKYDGKPSDVFIANDPSQLKSADFNTGEFGYSDDIRYSKKEEAIGDRTDVSKLAPGKPVPESAYVSSLQHAYEIAKSRTFKTVRELKMALQAVTLKAAQAAGVDLNAHTQETHKYLVNQLVADAEFALQSNQNAIGWYGKTVSRSLGASAEMYPEILTSTKHRVVFMWLLASTSNGLKVKQNYELTDQGYQRFVKTGVMPVDIGIGNASSAINKALALYTTTREKFVGLFGEEHADERLLQFMVSNFNVSEIEKSLGVTIGGEWASTPVLGAAILGPKIGNGFFGNLNGYFDQLTIDRWNMRTHGRMTGTLIGVAPEDVSKSRSNLIAKIAALSPKERKIFSDVVGHKVTKGLTRSELDLLAKKANKASIFPAKRSIMSGSPALNEMRKAANNHHITLDGQKEAPSGPSERNWIRAYNAAALKILQGKWADLTMSDLQALLWYAERRLYDAAKSESEYDEGYEDDEAPDYANAAFNLAVKRGLPAEQVRAAMDKAEAQGVIKNPPLSEHDKTLILQKLRAAPEQQLQLAYEAAPNPDDAVATARWEQASVKERAAITKLVKDGVIPDLLSLTGIKTASTVQALGGYEMHVNPNIITRYKKKSVSIADARSLASVVGFVTEQKEVALVDPRADGEVGMVRVTLSGKADKYSEQILKAINQAVPGIDAFTTVGNNFDVLNFTGLQTEELRDKIDAVMEALNLPVDSASSHGVTKSELVGADDYDSHISRIRSGTGEEVRTGLLRLRDRSRQIISDELAKIELARGVTGVARRDAGADSIQQSSRDIRSSGRDVHQHSVKRAIHYGNSPGISTLSGSSSGTGIKGAEQARLQQATDPRLKKRVYFYLPTEGGIPQAETGLGGHVYQADLDGLYDPTKGSQVVFGKGANDFESKILDAGYKGYVNHEQGTIVMLNQDVPVKAIGMVGDHKVVQRNNVRIVPKIQTRQEGQELVRQPQGTEVMDLIKNASAIKDAAPSYRMEYGSARVKQDQAQAADKVLSDAGSSFQWGEVQFSSRDLGFYSELAAQIDKSTMKQAPAGAWKQFIGALSQKGVKADEVEWSGINDFLKMQEGKVTKEQVSEFLKNNGVKVEEVTLGAQKMEYRVQEKQFGRWEDLESFDNEEDAADQLSDLQDGDGIFRIHESEVESDSDVKYDQYVLPGGENYREVLLTLPPPKSTVEEAQDRARRRELSDLTMQRKLTDAEHEEMKAIVARQRSRPKAQQYQSSHWDQPNVLAHIRLNDRTDAEGKRVLFVEEVQSDWGQEGKKKGFSSPSKIEIKKVPVAKNPYNDGFMYQAVVDGKELGLQPSEGSARAEAEGSKKSESGVPAAPFVGKTDAWVNLALKRIVKMAVDEGYDRVAFVNGEQSADRYDLSKQISVIQYRVSGDDNYRLSVYDKNGSSVQVPNSLDADGLEAHVGKDLAQKIIDTATPETQSLKGLDLKVGGEGMRKFYDSIIPNAVKGLLKKFGGGQLESVRFLKAEVQQVGRSFQVEVDGEVKKFSSQQNAIEYLIKFGNAMKQQPGFTITPAMKEKVGQGLPLFSARDQTETPAFKKWFGDWETLADLTTTSSASFDDAQKALKAVAGKPLTNDETGVVAYINRDQRDKILSSAARRKSESNGFTDAQHYAVASRIGQLFKHAVLIGDFPDAKNKDANLRIKRFAAPVFMDGDARYVTLLAKETISDDEGHRIYTLEVHEEETLQGALGTNTSEAGDTRTPARSVEEIMTLIGAKVNSLSGVSKVVDADGKPLIVYHGTRSDIKSFDRAKIGSNFGMDSSGFFFASDPGSASEFAAPFGEDSAGANVLPVYLSIKNPLTIELFAKEHQLDIKQEMDGFDSIGEFFDYNRPEIESALKSGQYDGVSFSYGGDSIYVATSATQIKSAIGNSGEFSSEDQDINNSKRDFVGRTNRAYTPEQLKAFANVGFEVEEPSFKERMQALWKDAGKKLAQGIVDQFAPMKDIDTKAYGLLRLAKGASGAFETMLKGGRLKLTDGVYDFDETKKGGVVDSLLMPMQGEHHDFLRWVAANRAERLMGEDREHLFTQDDIDAIKTLEDGDLKFDYTLKHGPNAGTTTRVRSEMFKDSLTTFNEFHENVMDMAEQSGLVDKEARRLWDHEFYVPFYRVSEEDGVAGAGIKGGAVRQQAFKKLKGGTDVLNADLLDNTLMNWAHLLDASAKNRAAKASLEAAERVGVALSTTEETARQMGKATGNKQGVVWFMDDGKQHYYLVEDPFVLQAITSLEYAGMKGPMMDAMSTVKNMLTVGVTASPFFKVRNLIRDSLQVIGTGPIDYNVAKNLKDGWKLTDPKNDMYFRLLAGGGTIHFGTMYEGSEAKRVQALVESGVDRSTILDDEHKFKAFYRRWVEPGITAYQELGNRGEAINRAALYDQLIKQGVSHADASLQARDLMDFSMGGTFATVRFLTQVVPFLNARLQGLYKLGRAAKDDPKRMAYVTGAVTMASLALLAAYGDDDDWRKREEFDRNNFWWFKFGGQAFRIPKPFEVGAVATLAERTAELVFDDEMTATQFRKQVMTLLGDNLSMNPVPQLVKPMLDVYSNKDSFSGRPIETMSMERLQKEYRFNGNTSMAARAASTAMNAATGLVGKEALSPVQVDQLIRGYFGWLGTFVVGGADIGARYVTDQPDKPASDLWKAATGGMVSQLEDAPSKYVSHVYDQAKVLEQAYGTWKALQKEGKTEEAGDFKAANEESIRGYKNLEAIKGALAKINQQIRAIERSDKTSDEKREEIRRLRARQDQFSRRLAA